ncbi:MAG: hypothetical protein Q4G59_02765, partial [Planctomycetia bacterium]|nr:hypothetical protein [Planctomycetia bacterium]
EALAQLLRSSPHWRPDVYKGFAYSLGWFGINDYYATNVRSSVKPTSGNIMNETGVFLWSERIRLPVYSCGLARTLFNANAFITFSGYSSQDTMARAGRIVNGDRVFWFRPTTSLLYNAKIETTSGVTTCLNDFKLFDSSDVTNLRLKPDQGVWIPDANDNEKTITVRFPEPTSIESIVFYDNPSPVDNILAATIRFDDGSIVEVGKLNPSGAASTVSFEPRTVHSFSVQLTQGEGSSFGLTELDAFTKTPKPKLTIAKLVNRQGDFLYDYIIDSSGTETFGLYCLGNINAESLTPSVDDLQCRFERQGNQFVAYCPYGKSCVVTLQTPDGKMVEQVRLRNPSRFERINLATRQKIESVRFHLNFYCQAEYYAEWIVSLFYGLAAIIH